MFELVRSLTHDTKKFFFQESHKEMSIVVVYNNNLLIKIWIDIYKYKEYAYSKYTHK